MTPERWQHIDAIFQAAIELNPGERAAFLRTSCGDDEELRSEVESLITADEEGFSLIEAPAFEIAAGMLADDGLELAEGEHLGNYEILVLLGVGGMGEVYLAEDANLGRKIALKFLPVDFTHDKERLRRFRQEARAASALNHPNILTIHEINQVENRYYIATEFVDGETLRQRLICSMLTLHEALDIAVQVASALAAAHQAGIVHRDIKPENIMVRRDGIVKVLDFGLAKLAEQQRGDFIESPEAVKNSLAKLRKRHGVKSEALTLIDTRGGIVMGTVHYMSPEQARGLEVDERTDVWSFGVVLHEVLAGRTPYEGKTVGEIISSIQQGEPPQLNNCALEVRAELGPIVRKCLETDREHRYQSGQELLDDLRNLKREVESGAVGKAGGPQRKLLTKHYAQTAALLATIMIVAALIYLSLLRDTPTTFSPEIKSLAVLPLKNLSGDPAQDLLADGMTETLISDLAKIGALRVISHTSVKRYKGQQKPLPQIARELNIDAVLEGTVLRSGGQVRVAAKLIHIRTGRQLWADSYERDLGDILALQQEVARGIASEIRIKLTPQEQARLTNARHVNTDAYEAYLVGKSFLDKRNENAIRTAITYLDEAIAKDGSYALPYVAKSEAYFALGTVHLSAMPPTEALAKGEAAALKALELDETLAEAHTALGVVKCYGWDWPTAEREFKRALELNPSYAQAHGWYAVYLAARGRLGEAIARMYRARDLDPLSPHINQSVGWMLHYARQVDESIEQFERALELDPNFLFARLRLASAYSAKGMFNEAIAEYERAIALSDRNPSALAGLAHTYGRSGRRREARQILRELLEMREHGYVNPHSIAIAYLGLGEKERGFEWLEKAYQEHSYGLVFLKVGPEYDPLRLDPRFTDLLRRVGLS